MSTNTKNGVLKGEGDWRSYHAAQRSSCGRQSQTEGLESRCALTGRCEWRAGSPRPRQSQSRGCSRGLVPGPDDRARQHAARGVFHRVAQHSNGCFTESDNQSQRSDATTRWMRGQMSSRFGECLAGVGCRACAEVSIPHSGYSLFNQNVTDESAIITARASWESHGRSV
jgi:hypothetical protein